MSPRSPINFYIYALCPLNPEANPTPLLAQVKNYFNPLPRIFNKGVAGNSNTPIEILEMLSKDKSSIVRSKVAQNHNTPGEIRSELSKDEDWCVRTAAESTDAFISILEEQAKAE